MADEAIEEEEERQKEAWTDQLASVTSSLGDLGSAGGLRGILLGDQPDTYITTTTADLPPWLLPVAAIVTALGLGALLLRR